MPMFSLTAMTNELGKRGANTVFASANSHEDNDANLHLSGEASTSPYVITVSSAMANGKPSEFSNYGQTTVHVYAPGSNIMSTAPELLSRQVDAADKTKQHGYARYTRYFPQATDAQNNLAYETFAGNSGVRVFKENPATNPAAEEITSQAQIVEGLGYGDWRALAIPVSELNKQEADSQTPRGIDAVNGYAYLAIPVASAEAAKQVKWASVNMAMSDAFKPTASLESITCAKADSSGAPVEVDTAATKAIDTAEDAGNPGCKGWAAAASLSVYQTQWSCYSYSVDGLVGAYNKVHEPNAGAGDVYAWQNNNKAYVIAKVAMGRETNAVKAGDNTKLCVDNVALGNADAYAGAYQTMSGTSMSAPVVAGCLAVIAKGERESAQLTEDERELQARERAAKLLASVEYDEDLGTLCRTGGRVNLAQNPGFTKKAPLLYRADSDGSTLTIRGCFFGTGGTLAVDDESAAVSSWEDGTITADVSSLGNGSHVAKVVTADGCVMRIVFAQSEGPKAAPNDTLPLYENTHAVPVSASGFEKDDCLYGPLVGCGGYMFAQAATTGNHAAQDFWRYSIATDTWSKHDLPQGYGTPANPGAPYSIPALNKGGMVAYHNMLYLVGARRAETGNDYIGTLWKYDIDKDAWEIVDLQIPAACSLVVMGDDLLAIGGSYEGIFQGDDAGVRAAKIDVDGRRLTPIAGAELLDGNQPRAVATSSKIYVYEEVRDATTGRDATRFSRLTYNKGAAKLDVEDLTDAFNATGLVADTSKRTYGAGAHVALAGLPDGVALVGAAMKDDGSYALGQDTRVIYDDANEATAFDRTSSYYRPFDPMATYYDGKLYVVAQSVTESEGMYFRSTQIEKPAEPATYAVVLGDGSTWTKGSTDALTFRVKRSEADDQTYDRFTGIKVDGNAVDSKSFEAKAGSLVLSLKPAYLQGLDAREHKIEFSFDDNTASATFKVANAEGGGSTDDDSGSGAQDDSGSQGGTGTQGGSGAQGTTRSATTLAKTAKTADMSASPVALLVIGTVAVLASVGIRKKSNPL